MGENKLNLIGRINDAQQHITEVFLHQCTYGAQTKRLPAEFAACGQFIGGHAQEIRQYGLHGISAALRVLAECQSEECRSIVPRIVSYCEGCFGVNPKLQLEPDLQVRADDKQNVIKLGELLYGLSFVTTAQAERDGLIRYIAEMLTNSLIDGKGWGYFLGDKAAELLPTAYAVRGLAQNGYDISGPRRFLLDSLGARRTARSSPADLTTAVACTYCLTFCPSTTGEQDPVLKKTFFSVWSPLEPLLAEDIEQNLEYWRGEQTYYVRIPWQLYLLALASEYSRWRLAGFRAQRRLNRVIDALRSASFRYPYSGTYLSSRTHGVAYEILAAIRNRIRRLLWLRLANAIDAVRVFVGSRGVRRVATVLALGVIVYSVSLWWQTGKSSDLAPNFVSAVIVLLLAWGRR